MLSKRFLSFWKTNVITALSPSLRLRQAKQAKMASKKVDVWGHVLTALAAPGFGSDSRVEVAVCAYACVCTYMLVYFSGAWGGSGKEHSQRIVGPMPGEIMNLSNRILGNGGDSSCGKNEVIKRHLEPLVSWRVAALT